MRHLPALTEDSLSTHVDFMSFIDHALHLSQFYQFSDVHVWQLFVSLVLILSFVAYKSSAVQQLKGCPIFTVRRIHRELQDLK